MAVSASVTSEWAELAQAIRKQCGVGLWSKGVEFARLGVVLGESHTGKEWSFRVRAPGRPIAPTVRLFPGDDEWECDCGGRFDPCEHIAAAVSAVAQASDPEDLYAVASGGHAAVHYCLVATEHGLCVDRSVAIDGKAVAIEDPITSCIAEGQELGFAPTHDDLAVDRLIGRFPKRAILFDKAGALLSALSETRHIQYDGRAVTTSTEPVLPIATVLDHSSGGVELRIKRPAVVSAIIAPGIARCDDVLRPLGGGKRFGERWERIPFRRVFPRNKVGELAGKILPDLQRHIEVEIKTKRLPDSRPKLTPWIHFDIDNQGRGIEVLPTLVYGDPPTARVHGGRLVLVQGDAPVRNEDAEEQVLRRLRDQLDMIPGRRVAYKPSDAARFLTRLEKFDAGRSKKRIPSLAIIDRRKVLQPKLTPKGDSYDLTFQATEVGQEPGKKAPTVKPATVLGAWRDGIDVVPLSDGTFASLPTAWLEEHGELVADLVAATKANKGAMPTAALPMLGELCEALEMPPPVELSRLRALLEAPDLKEPLPDDFDGELREYQAEGVAWLRRLRRAGLGAVLADDMGLGKTVQTLCVVSGPTLVICPRSVIHNWQREAEKFRPGLSVALYHGPKRKLTKADITLTTYATLRNDIEVMSAQEWETVVLDEAQAIKNPGSRTAQAVYKIPAEFRLSLSGTPVENRLDELWSQLHFTNRGLLGGRRDFAKRYEHGVVAGDEGSIARLQQRIRPFLLRRLKSEVAKDLPARTESVLYCELDTDERVAYDSVLAASRKDVVDELDDKKGGKGVLAALEALLRLRQASCHTGLLPGRSAKTSSKVEALCDALDDAAADGHKALVFSQWTGMLDKVEPHLKSHGIDFLRIDGKTRDRGAIVDKFQSEAGDGPPVLLISLTAGGTGLNLTAADHVFLLDPWWNPAVEDQAADRAHRIGQDRPVMIYRLVAKDTVEERVLELQARKRRVASAALAGAGGAEITREDIMALLG